MYCVNGEIEMVSFQAVFLEFFVLVYDTAQAEAFLLHAGKKK